jgi:hypothetical protein
MAAEAGGCGEAPEGKGSEGSGGRGRWGHDGGLAIVRIKPMNAGGGGVESSGKGLGDGEGALRFGPDHCRGISVGSKTFTYPEHVIPPSLDNAGLYDMFLPQRVDALFEGVNVNVVCYGQTGTGKTHTTFGTPGIMGRAARGDYGLDVDRDYGIFPRALLAIFARARALGDACVLTCAAIELSLLGNRCMFEPDRAKCAQGLTSPEAYGVTIDKAKKPPQMYGMREVVLESEDDIFRTFRAIASRNTAGTGMNDSSSRTHCFAFINLYITTDGGETVRCSRFQCVDLAGSERLKDAAGTSDFRESETALTGLCTNFSLMQLSQCVRDLIRHQRERRRRGKNFSLRPYLGDLVPLLSESMSGRALTAIFVCISQAPANASQTSHALNFGSDFAQLKVNGCQVEPVSVAVLAREAERQIAEAEKVLAVTKSVKYVVIRRAQILEAEQRLDVLGRLRAHGCG